MPIEQLITQLQEIAAAHPGVSVWVWDSGDDYGAYLVPEPTWNQRDGKVYF